MAQCPPLPAPSLSASQLEQLLERLRQHLPEELFTQVQHLLRVLCWVLQVLAEKKIGLQRLPDLLFRSRNEQASQIFAPAPANSETPPSLPRRARKGHGRRKSAEYSGATVQAVSHPDLRPGQLCGKCQKGKLYLLTPARLLSMIARPIFDATRHELQRLRCALGGALFTAPAPPAAAQGKYDPSVGAMLAILRYGAGLPMYRIAKWQACFGVPLPAATQWQLLEQATAVPQVIMDQLLQLGAQGSLLHNDDTSMRVQSLRREIAAEAPGGRTGLFTTSILCQTGPHLVALFFTGRQHAGENLQQLLRLRAATLAPPLQMSDALSRNTPQESTTEICHCLLHGRRNFVEQIENFPAESRHVIESIGQVYRIEREIADARLSQAERLQTHQNLSGPIMESLRAWMQKQIEDRKVEPNSGFGRAIRMRYSIFTMRRFWFTAPFTRRNLPINFHLFIRWQGLL